MNRFKGTFARALLIGLALMAAPGWGHAEETKPKLCPFCKAALDKDARYDEKAGNTLMRGAINFGFGWTEMITQPAKVAEAGGNVFEGMVKGMGRGFNRTFAGLGEILTFWTPKIDGKYVHFVKDCPLDTDGK